MKLGPLTISPPIIEAALSGYSDRPMRVLAKRFGCPFTLSSVFLDRFVLDVSKRGKAKFHLTVEEADHPCGAQLMGSDPAEFVAAAERLISFGFDLIDLNFACPVKKVLGRARGGSLMADVPRALKIAEAVRNALPDSIPVTVKLRKGFDGSDESREKFFALLDGLLGAGIAGATLHGRTVLERYTGSADWEFVRQVKTYLTEKDRGDFTLLGSGDLFSADICRRRLTESGVDGLALARGIVGNPWLFREAAAALAQKPFPAPPSVAEQCETIRMHWQMAEDLYGAKRAAASMRKFLLRYALRHPDAVRVKEEFITLRGRESLEEIFARYYGEK